MFYFFGFVLLFLFLFSMTLSIFSCYCGNAHELGRRAAHAKIKQSPFDEDTVQHYYWQQGYYLGELEVAEGNQSKIGGGT